MRWTLLAVGLRRIYLVEIKSAPRRCRATGELAVSAWRTGAQDGQPLGLANNPEAKKLNSVLAPLPALGRQRVPCVEGAGVSVAPDRGSRDWRNLAERVPPIDQLARADI
jgi:hypothetical protein